METKDKNSKKVFQRMQESNSVLRPFVFGVCGWSGAGKTTLIESVLPRLENWGLKVLVMKHDMHCIKLDTAGKDSARFFDAGADVLLVGGDQEFFRKHRTQQRNPLDNIHVQAGDYDLVLIEGFKELPVKKVWLLGPEENIPPPGCRNIIAVLERDAERGNKFLAVLRQRLSN